MVESFYLLSGSNKEDKECRVTIVRPILLNPVTTKDYTFFLPWLLVM